MDYGIVMQRMVAENKSIREMAKELGVSKSTLHYRLQKYRKKTNDESLLIDYEILLKDNFNGKNIKGANKRWHKN